MLSTYDDRQFLEGRQPKWADYKNKKIIKIVVNNYLGTMGIAVGCLQKCENFEFCRLQSRFVFLR